MSARAEPVFDEISSESESDQDEMEDDSEYDEMMWNEKALDYNVIDMKMDPTDMKLVADLRDEITVIAQRCLNELNKNGINEELNELNSVHCFLTREVLQVIESIIRKNWSSSPNRSHSFEHKDFQNFIRVISGLSFYKVSPAMAFSNIGCFGLIDEALMKLGSIKFSLIMQAISKLDKHHGHYWESYFSPNEDMCELAHKASLQCSSVGFVEGVTDLVIDDDKFRMRSSKSSESGWVRTKGKKSFGPVNNCVNSTTTGFLGSHMGEGAVDVTEINLQVIAKQRLSRNIRLPRATLNGDRGYNDKSFFEFLAASQLRFMNIDVPENKG